MVVLVRALPPYTPRQLHLGSSWQGCKARHTWPCELTGVSVR